MALDFDKLKPEAKKAAFAHMDRARGVGSFRKKGSGAITGRLFDKPKTARGKSSLGSGTRHKKLTAGQKGGIKATPKSTPKATPETPASRFDNALTEDIKAITSRPGNSDFASMAALRKTLDARGLSRAEQDTHLKRMSRERKINIVPEDNRKALRQEDHDTAIHIGGEPNHLVTLADDTSRPNSAPVPGAGTKAAPLRSTDPKKLAESRTPAEYKTLAENYLESHGSDGVAFKINQLEKRQKLSPGQRAQLAALKSLGNK